MVKRNWLKWVLVIYLTVTVVALIARFVLPTSNWVSWAIDHFLLIFFVPIPILFLICLLLREWKDFILLTLPALAFMILYGRLFIPSRGLESRSDAIPLRVMTFNVLFTNSDQAAVAQVIKDSGAELVALFGFNALIMFGIPQASSRFQHRFSRMGSRIIIHW